MMVHCHTYFQTIFFINPYTPQASVPLYLPRVISQEHNSTFLTPQSIDEIRQPTFSIDSSKAPGPDGFNAKFFKEFWMDLKEHIVQLVNSFFCEGVLSEKLNDTIIMLVPKLDSPLRLKDYRPISLCNTHYKIISKIIATRFPPLILRFISENQGAFLPKRSTMDNIILASEISHCMAQKHRKKICRCTQGGH